jgi:hypothetical protein
MKDLSVTLCMTLYDFVIWQTNNEERNFVPNRNTYNYNINGTYYPTVEHVPDNNTMASPLNFRFCSYLMAMFNFNYELISSLNTFEDIAKLRYLPCSSVFSKEKINENLRVKYHISYSPKD